MSLHIIMALRKTTSDLILADGVFDNCIAGPTDCVHDEGTWVLLTTDQSNGSQLTGEVFNSDHSDRLVLVVK